MMPEKVIFSIPIYSKSYSKFKKDTEERLKNYLEKKKEQWEKLIIKPEHFDEQFFTKMFYNSLGNRGWHYNFIIGWIEFYLNGKILKAQYWFVNARRITHNLKNKVFKYKEKISDVSLTHRRNNSELRKDINDFLICCKKGEYSSRFKKYCRDFFIDDNYLLDLLEFVDIKALIEKNLINSSGLVE